MATGIGQRHGFNEGVACAQDEAPAGGGNVDRLPHDLLDLARGRHRHDVVQVDVAHQREGAPVPALDLRDVHSRGRLQRVQPLEPAGDDLVQDGSELAVRVEEHPGRSGGA